MIRHFTATVYVFWENKVLLHPHPKHQKWLPPGGHVEENETPVDAAKRETLEETGLHIEILADDPIRVDTPYARNFARPFLCLLEDIPERKGEPAHQHMDLIYLAKPLGNPEKILSPFRWLTLEELQGFPAETVFPDTLLVTSYLLKQERCISALTN